MQTYHSSQQAVIGLSRRLFSFWHACHSLGLFTDVSCLCKKAEAWASHQNMNIVFLGGLLYWLAWSYLITQSTAHCSVDSESWGYCQMLYYITIRCVAWFLQLRNEIESTMFCWLYSINMPGWDKSGFRLFKRTLHSQNKTYKTVTRVVSFQY